MAPPLASLVAFLWLSTTLLFAGVSSQDTSQVFSARQLYSLTAYKDVQLFRYNVPEEMVAAQWTLFSNGTQNCDPLQIQFHLRWKGYPLLNINNATIAARYLVKEREQYQLQLASDSKRVTFNLTNPLPGDYYGLAYIAQTDDRIVQKGLFKRCQAWLTSSLTFTPLASQTERGGAAQDLADGAPLDQSIATAKYYKFFVPLRMSSAKINVSGCAEVDKNGKETHSAACPLNLYFRAGGLPDTNKFDRMSDCTEVEENADCTLSELIISRGGWNYLLIDPVQSRSKANAKVDFQMLLTTGDCLNKSAGIELVELSMTDKDSHLEPSSTGNPLHDGNVENTRSTSPEPVLEAKPPYVLPLTGGRVRHGPRHILNESTFDTCPQRIKLVRYNSQGNFAFKYDVANGLGAANFTNPTQPFLAIPNSHQNSTKLALIDFEVTPVIDGGGTLAIELGISPSSNTTYHNITVSLCLEHGHASLKFGHNCLKQIQVNTSSDAAHFTSIYVPFPRSGLWFITLKSSCYFHDRLQKGGVQTTHPVPCEFNTTSVLLNVKSSACVASVCAQHGKCNQYVTGGLIFSTCVCKTGWKGWSCEDGSQVTSEEGLLFNFLLLTLSNCAFLPSVILAAYRRHFTEALVYFVTMVSSGLYHACDSQSERALCLVNVNILQFGDFYSALLAFWVTLISLANLSDKLKTFLHTFGGIFIAFAVEYDRTSLWAFAVPSGLGATIMLIGWLTQCIRRRSCYPSGKHWCFSILPGLVLAGSGLVVYGFFETKDNYAITHSIWHASMGAALLFLVPSIKRDRKREDDDFRATASMQNAKLAHVEWRPNTSFKFLQDDIDML